MTPIIFEVRCNLPSESPLWDDINTLTLEIGYPGRGGQMLWKHIGWLRDQVLPTGKGIAHALWDQTTAGLVLLFDFLPVLLPNALEPERSYRFRKSIKMPNGRLHTKKSGILRGEHYDEHFTFSPRYPDSRNLHTS